MSSMAAQTMYDGMAWWGGDERPQEEPARVLIADDQPDVRYALCLLLKSAGYETQTASGPAEALAAIRSRPIDIVVADLNYTRDTTSGGEGLDLIAQVRAIDAELPVLAMTAWGSIELAVEAMRRGAADFVQKPWSAHQVLEKVSSLAGLRRNARRLCLEEQQERGEAAAIQSKLLSFEAPLMREWVSGTSRSLRFVGGDYCKVDQVTDQEIAISIADVAGKGVPGALLAASLRAAERPLVAQSLSPSEICAALNQAMGEITPPGKFISFFFARLDFERKSLVYSNAGHNPPLLVKASGEVRALADGGAVLGYFPEWRYEQAEVSLDSGDRIVLFTDGIVEAGGAAHGEYGVERLAQLVVEHRADTASEMQRALIESVSRHCAGDFQDDATLVVIAVP